MHREPSWSTIPPRSPGMLPRGRLHLHAEALPRPSPARGRGLAEPVSHLPFAAHQQVTPVASWRLNRCGKERAVAMETRCQTGRAAPSLKTRHELCRPTDEEEPEQLTGSTGPRGCKPQPPAPRKMGKMHKGDSRQWCRWDALLQERTGGGTVRMLRTKWQSTVHPVTGTARPWGRSLLPPVWGHARGAHASPELGGLAAPCIPHPHCRCTHSHSWPPHGQEHP